MIKDTCNSRLTRIERDSPINRISRPGRAARQKHQTAYLRGISIFLLPLFCRSSPLPAASPSDQSWPSYGRTQDQAHYSPLSDINALNVHELGLAWSYDIPGYLMPLSVPLEVDGRLYVATGYSVVRAMDAVSGRLLWTYDPNVAAVAGEKLIAGIGVRGIAFWNGRIYVGTQDGRLISIDANSGQPIWSVQTTDPKEIRYITGPPLIFRGKVLVGHGGSENSAIRGYVTAYDALTGKQVWRFFTVPGDPKRGFESKAMERASKTWTGRWWEYGGGGTVWNAMTYDSRLNQVYIGTSNGTPWNQKIRSPGGGDNLFLASIIALNADTGTYIWHYQANPAEVLDYDAVEDIELADLRVGSTRRPVLMQASKNGFFYVIDRFTGRLISAEKFCKVTWAYRIDITTGRPVETPSARYDTGETTVWPGAFGGHGVQPMAFNPRLKLAYIPVRDLPTEYSDKGIDVKAWRFDPKAFLNLGVNFKLHLPESESMAQGVNSLVAWDPEKKRAAWRVPLPAVKGSGVATTAGNLVFQGRPDGKLVAYAANIGRQLWAYDVGVSDIGPPIIYKVRGQAYVSILAGSGGWHTPPQRLLTFALGHRAQLPPHKQEEVTPVSDPEFMPNSEVEQRGAKSFDLCVDCHGHEAVSNGIAPDLRASPSIVSPRMFNGIVRGGALRGQGMPPFTDMRDVEIESIRQYLRSRARNLTLSRSAEDP
jgi:quinohemoprotein ethanol dehydrogenase